MTEFEKYLKQAREEFAYEVSKYTLENNLSLRTASDSLLIAFDQATQEAINYSQCCETLPTDEQIYSEACIYVRKIENPRNYTNIKLRQAYKNGAKFILNALKSQK